MLLHTVLALFALLGAGQPSRFPLLDQCHEMSLIAKELASGLSGNNHHSDVNCSLVLHRSRTNSLPAAAPASDCSLIQCHDNVSTRNFTLELVPCASLPAVRVMQNDSLGFVVSTTLTTSETISLELSGNVFLFFRIEQHSDQLSLGLEVLLVDITKSTKSKNITIVPYSEIPLDKKSCPGAARTSDTCQVMKNVSEHLRHFLAAINKVESATVCAVSLSCNDISCILPGGDFYNMSILACGSTPALQLATSGYNHTVAQSERLLHDPVHGITLNVTAKVVDHFTMGVELDFINTTVGNELSVVIPYVEILLDRSTCISDDYTLEPLVSTCDIMPLLSHWTLTTNLLNDSCFLNNGCATSSCHLSSLGNVTVDVTLYSCFQPPNLKIVVSNADGTTAIVVKKSSLSSINSVTVNGRELDLNITIVQRPSHSSVGLHVQVTGRSGDHALTTLIPYHEIPVNCSQHTSHVQISDTCLVMTNVAQYITVFLANITNHPELTPVCTVLGSLCHSIKCSSADGSIYNIDVLPCTDPPKLQLEIHRPKFNTFRQTYLANSRVTEHLDDNVRLQVTMSYEVNAILLELLVIYNDSTHSFNLPVIPYVHIPINSSFDCDITTTTTTATTAAPNDNSYHALYLSIEIGVPSVLIFLFTFTCLLCLLCKCVHDHVTKKRTNYSLLRVTAALDSDDESIDDNEEEEEEDEEYNA